MKSYQDSMLVIEINKDFEVKVIDFVVKGTHEFSEDKLDMLSQATIQMFDLQKTEYLAVFYRLRVQPDFSSKIPLPNKVTLAKLRDGEIDKKIRGPLLVKLCFDARSLPVISEDTVMRTVQFPMMQIKPPTVFTYHVDVTVIVEEMINAQWLNRCFHVIQILCFDKREGVDIPFINSMDILVRCSDLCAKRLSCRLYDFFEGKNTNTEN